MIFTRFAIIFLTTGGLVNLYVAFARHSSVSFTTAVINFLGAAICWYMYRDMKQMDIEIKEIDIEIEAIQANTAKLQAELLERHGYDSTLDHNTNAKNIAKKLYGVNLN